MLHRKPGTPYPLVALYRAPPPVNRMWWRDRDAIRRVLPLPLGARRATVIGQSGTAILPIRVFAVRRAHAWVGYSSNMIASLVFTTGPLDPRDRGVLWCWGHRGKNVEALKVVEALR